MPRAGADSPLEKEETMTETAPPLDGIRIVDLSDEAGAFAARQLAELGADVIRVEPPGGGPNRRRRPLLNGASGPEASLYHLHFSSGLRSLELDIETDEGADLLRRLVSTADALIETAAPGAMEQLGLGFETLREINPRLLYVTITPFGQDGPFSGYLGDDLIGAATSGLMYLNGLPERPPIVPGAEQAFHMASLAAVSTLLAALVGRDRGATRGGHRIDVSIQEAASMATLQTANANIYTWHGGIPTRVGLAGLAGPHLYRCADGRWVSFVIPLNAPRLWRNFVDWMQEEGISEVFVGERWTDPAFRAENRAELTDAISQLCARHERAYIFREGQRRQMLVMPVNNARDLLEDDHLRQRHTFGATRHPHLERDLVDAEPPFRFSTSPVAKRRPAPTLGEHSRVILDELAAAGRTAETRKAPLTESPIGSPDTARLLEGIRVADLFWLIAGPATSRILADYGADVIKIESLSRIDTIRIAGVQPTDPGTHDTCGVFNDVNTNKRSVQLNLNHPRGIELLKELVRQSDVLTNNFTGDRMDRWGLGYEELSRINPRLIMLTMPVFGTSGPYLRYGAYGNGVIAFSGLSHNMGRADEPPIGIAPLYSDFSAPYTAASAILAALHHRERTGEGQFIELAQVEATINQLGTDILEVSSNGQLPPRNGNRSRDYAPHDVYRCSGDDRWIAISVHDDTEWRQLAQVVGGDELAADERFATHSTRQAHLDELDTVLEAWTTPRDAWPTMHLLQQAGIRAGVVENLEDMVTKDPQLGQRHFVELSREDEPFTFTTHNQPARIDGAVPPLHRAPRLGEHNEAVYKELLGITDDEYIDLLADGVLH